MLVVAKMRKGKVGPEDRVEDGLKAGCDAVGEVPYVAPKPREAVAAKLGLTWVGKGAVRVNKKAKELRVAVTSSGSLPLYSWSK